MVNLIILTNESGGKIEIVSNNVREKMKLRRMIMSKIKKPNNSRRLNKKVIKTKVQVHTYELLFIITMNLE
jgi:hypothetical protein